jgi:hypothetical protein
MEATIIFMGVKCTGKLVPNDYAELRQLKGVVVLEDYRNYIANKAHRAVKEFNPQSK